MTIDDVDNETDQAADADVSDEGSDGGAVAMALASAGGADERLAYRGVIQRLLVRPEIGAVIGALAIWAFFWAVAVPFGNAGGIATVLDVSATLGIMAVAVSLLMIGGEFDLSSGAATGALGIVIILLVKETGDLGGLGLNLWIALPISLLVALGLGWVNGFMVERTALPSFIVTLATFFVLRGGKLGFSRLIVDNIQVGRIEDAKGRGWEFWHVVFAAEWSRNDWQWAWRDPIYVIGVLTGFGLLAIAMYELNFVRAEKKNPLGILGLLVGLGGIVGATYAMHQTDGYSTNALLAGAIVVAALIAVFGLGFWRYETRAANAPAHGASADSSSSLRNQVPFVVGGLALLGLGIAAGFGLDSTNNESIYYLFTEQGFRAIFFVGFAVAGMILLLIAANRAGRSSVRAKTALLLLTAAALTGVAFVVQAESQSFKFRAELFSVMIAIAAAIAIWSLSLSVFLERRFQDVAADRLGRLVAMAGMALMTVGFLARLLFTTDAEIARSVNPATFSVRILWFVAFTVLAAWVLARTQFGSWIYAVGGNKEASRQVGVPAGRTKTQLFMIVAFAAWLVGMLLAFRLNTIQASTGNGLEFEYIIAAVVGGTLLTGGYGSAIGAAIGALIMAMSKQGIPFANWNSDWRFMFLGVILLLAVIGNRFIREQAEASR